MQKYHNTIQDTAGNIITTATITVYDAGTLSTAAIFEDDGITAIPNPFTVASNAYNDKGAFFFKAANGDYDIKIDNGGNIVNLYDVTLFDFADATPYSVYDKLVDPTVNDDSSNGYEYGSKWVNTVTKEVFACVDPTDTAAVWIETTLEISELGTMATQNANAVAITGGTASGLTSLGVSGSITVTGNVDGRDVSADGSKLDTIEDNATADQTKGDIDALGIDAATLGGASEAEASTPSTIAKRNAAGDLIADAFRMDDAAVATNSANVVVADASGNMVMNSKANFISNLSLSTTSHNHSGVYEPAFSKNTAFNDNYGTGAGTVCQGNDSRLSDARTPTAHVHSAADVTTGTLAVARGGTGVTTSTGTGSTVRSASPALTGNPTAPTQTAGNNTTRLATTAFVTSAVSAGGYTHPSHPGDDFSIDTTLLSGATVISDLDINVTTDTLGHVTDANATVATRNLTAANIGAAATSHAHGAGDITSGTLAVARGGTGVTTSSGTGSTVRTNSPIFTGTPAAPTAAVSTNTTQLATCAFVLANGGGGAGSVGQSELKSTTASQSTSVGAGSLATLALTGGSYTMGWFVGASGNGTNMPIRAHNGTYLSTVGMFNTSTGSLTAYIYSRYVQASPPYNLGDGDIPLFVYALIDNGSGEIVATSAAKDPHWAYHGNHNITPDRVDKATGKKYKNVPKFITDEIDLKSAILSGDEAQREYVLEMLRNKTIQEVELTDAYKNQDMNIAPHPFIHEDLTNKTVVLLDPVSPMVLDLYELHKQAEFNAEANSHLPDLLHNDYIRIDNTALTRTMPSGVIAVAPRWKNT